MVDGVCGRHGSMGIRKILDNFDFLRPKQPCEMRHLKGTVSTCITNASNVKGVMQCLWLILKIIAEFLKCEFMVAYKRQAGEGVCWPGSGQELAPSGSEDWERLRGVGEPQAV